MGGVLASLRGDRIKIKSGKIKEIDRVMGRCPVTPEKFPVFLISGYRVLEALRAIRGWFIWVYPRMTRIARIFFETYFPQIQFV